MNNTSILVVEDEARMRVALRHAVQAYSAQNHYLRVFMAQLRRKLESDPAQPRWLITEPGVGYRLRSE